MTHPPEFGVVLPLILILFASVAVLLMRLTGWSTLARRARCLDRNGIREQSFHYVFLTVNGIGIPSRVVVSSVGVRLTPRAPASLLFGELFLPWDAIHLESSPELIRIVPYRSGKRIAIRSRAVAQSVIDECIRSQTTAERES